MPRFRASKKYRFRVYISLLSLTRYPLENSSLQVRCKLVLARGGYNEYSKKAIVTHNRAVWNSKAPDNYEDYDFKFPLELDHNPATGELNPLLCSFSVKRTNLSPNTPTSNNEVGNVSFNLSSLALNRQPTQRTFLLDKSKSNCHLSVVIFLSQVQGAATFKIPTDNSPFLLETGDFDQSSNSNNTQKTSANLLTTFYSQLHTHIVSSKQETKQLPPLRRPLYHSEEIVDLPIEDTNATESIESTSSSGKTPEAKSSRNSATTNNTYQYTKALVSKSIIESTSASDWRAIFQNKTVDSVLDTVEQLVIQALEEKELDPNLWE